MLDTGVLIGTEMMHDWTTAKKCYKKVMTSLCTSGKQNAVSELDQTKKLESKSESLIWKQNIEYFTAFHPPVTPCWNAKKKLQNINRTLIFN